MSKKYILLVFDFLLGLYLLIFKEEIVWGISLIGLSIVVLIAMVMWHTSRADVKKVKKQKWLTQEELELRRAILNYHVVGMTVTEFHQLARDWDAAFVEACPLGTWLLFEPSKLIPEIMVIGHVVETDQLLANQWGAHMLSLPKRGVNRYRGKILNPDKEIVEKGVRDILNVSLGVDEDQILPTARLKEDLGAESIDRLDITFRLQNKFHIKIPKAEGSEWKTIEDIFIYISVRSRPA